MMANDAHSISTETATICIFDATVVKHREDDIGGWPSVPADALAESQIGNALFLNLGEGGNYIVKASTSDDPTLSGYCLKSPSGVVFVGPADKMGSDTSKGNWGGFFVLVSQAYQKVSVTRCGNEVSINMQPTRPYRNEITGPIFLNRDSTGHHY